MCKLINMKTNYGVEIAVADIKKNILEKICELAYKCEMIDAIILFGSSVEARCTNRSDIDIVIISSCTESKLFKSKAFNEFKRELYGIDIEQNYDILYFKSIDTIKSKKELICKDILDRGKIIYKKGVA